MKRMHTSDGDIDRIECRPTSVNAERSIRKELWLDRDTQRNSETVAPFVMIWICTRGEHMYRTLSYQAVLREALSYCERYPCHFSMPHMAMPLFVNQPD